MVNIINILLSQRKLYYGLFWDKFCQLQAKTANPSTARQIHIQKHSCVAEGNELHITSRQMLLFKRIGIICKKVHTNGNNYFSKFQKENLLEKSTIWDGTFSGVTSAVIVISSALAGT